MNWRFRMSFSKLTPSDTNLNRWQVALAVGGVIVVGAGVYYYLLGNDKSKKSKSSKKSKPKTPSSPATAETFSEPETPLEKAQCGKNKGNKYFKGGKYEEAIKCYEEAIQMCPAENKTDLSTFYQNRAAAYEQLKNWENVMRDCTAALELNNRYVKALTRRAKACEVLKDLEQALEDLTTVCIIESFQNQGTLINVDRVLKDLGCQHAKEAMETRDPFMPSKHFVKSYFDSFIEDPIFNSLYKEKEGDVDESEHPPEKNTTNNGYLKAKQYLQEGSYNKVFDCCSNELANPLTAFKQESLLLRATICFLRGETKIARKDFDTLIGMEDLSLKVMVNALIKRGTLHMHEERIEDCLKDFDTAAVQDPLNSDVFHHMGQIQLLIGNVDAAMANFKKAVDLNPNFPIAVVQKCYTDYRYAHQMGDKAKIEVVMIKFEEAIRNFPKCVECYILYAQVLCDQEEHEKADELYLKAIEVDPENPSNLVHRALLVLQWKGDLDLSRKLIMEALEMDDQCEMAYENLATIEVQTGNLKRGVELFDKAIPLAKTEMEMAHLYSLRDAAVAQLKVVEKMGITVPNLGLL